MRRCSRVLEVVVCVCNCLHCCYKIFTMGKRLYTLQMILLSKFCFLFLLPMSRLNEFMHFVFAHLIDNASFPML